jgi:hypothetical protein
VHPRNGSPATKAPLQFLIGGAATATEASRRPRVGCTDESTIKRGAVPSRGGALANGQIDHDLDALKELLAVARKPASMAKGW